ncbi:MAG: hypothetical protein EBQ92_12780, partial [Proteobacteria bacterium]|nr:hypothetical protein [Pseudomonadota bacterium]
MVTVGEGCLVIVFDFSLMNFLYSCFSVGVGVFILGEERKIDWFIFFILLEIMATYGLLVDRLRRIADERFSIVERLVEEGVITRVIGV